jgi:hypothetical protein
MHNQTYVQISHKKGEKTVLISWPVLQFFKSNLTDKLERLLLSVTPIIVVPQRARPENPY